MQTWLPLSIATLLFPLPGAAERVEPSPAAGSRVEVRQEATHWSPVVASLWRGESAEVINTAPDWYQVRLSSGQIGFVSRDWAAARPVRSFSVHILDVEEGAAVIIDVGDREIVINGGGNIRVLHDYAENTGLIDGPVELVVVTNPAPGNWKGLRRIFDFDGRATTPRKALEYWDPGFDPQCTPPTSYDTFIGAISRIPGIRMRRPAAANLLSSDSLGVPHTVQLPSVPGARVALLHADASPAGEDCVGRAHNASIALLLEIEGVRLLFADLLGDSSAREGEEDSVRQSLLQLTQSDPLGLRSDLWQLSAAAAASAGPLMERVAPRWVALSGVGQSDEGKDPAVEAGGSQRTELRTDRQRDSNLDHIICTLRPGEQFSCDYVVP